MLHRLVLLLAVMGVASRATADHLQLDTRLEMDAPAFAVPGATITYSLRLSVLFPYASYVVVDTLPAGARFISSSPDSWNCLAQNGNLRCGTSTLQDTSAIVAVTIEAPPQLQTLVNSATIISLSTFDPNPNNNTATVQTVLYDAAACVSRRIDGLAPSDRAAVTAGTVTFRWSSVPNLVHYDVWVAESSSVSRLMETTSDTELVHAFAPGEVSWYVEAVMNDCPAVDTAPRRFTVTRSAPPRRRVVTH